MSATISQPMMIDITWLIFNLVPRFVIFIFKETPKKINFPKSFGRIIAK